MYKKPKHAFTITGTIYFKNGAKIELEEGDYYVMEDGRVRLIKGKVDVKYEDSVVEAIWIERMVNNKTYKEIQEKIGVSYYRIKKVIDGRLQNKVSRKGKRKKKRNK